MSAALHVANSRHTYTSGATCNMPAPCSNYRHGGMLRHCYMTFWPTQRRAKQCLLLYYDSEQVVRGMVLPMLAHVYSM
jgi:hypothetical protein